MDGYLVDDMQRADHPHIGWSGTDAHLRSVERQLDRRDQGEVDYLVVRGSDGRPVSKGGIDSRFESGAGSIMQLATRADLSGHGLATLLIAEAERRIRGRGLSRAVLAVEPENERARSLYEFLGYAPTGERETGWEYDLEDGSVGFYKTVVVDMEKAV